MIKKKFAWLFVAALFACMCIAPAAFAATTSATRARARVCTVAGCTKTAYHFHNGKLCRGHYEGDGHDHNWATCPVDGCSRLSVHRHNGVTYCGHTNDDGHNHGWGTCSVDGCTNTGDHTHSGHTYHGCSGHAQASSGNTGSSSHHSESHHSGGHHGH